MKNTYKIGAILLLIIAGCSKYKFPDIEQQQTTTTTPSAGANINLTKMVSIGNSLTAGYMNGCVYAQSQTNSFANIVANQFKLAGGGSYVQPTISATNGCFNPSGGCTQGRLILKISNGSPAPTPLPGDGLATFAFTGDKTAIQNFGVPGVTIGTTQLKDIGNPSSTYYNPYYARIASNPGTSTLLGDASTALANGGTFFTFWLGNNDVLGYATQGADDAQKYLLTSVANFTAYYHNAITTFMGAKADAKGVVMNIPDVTSIPYFSTVSYNPVPLDATTVATLNGAAAFGGYNYVLQQMVANKAALRLTDAQVTEIGTRYVTWAVSKINALLISDETLFDMGPYWDGMVQANMMTSTQRAGLEPYRKVRQATSSDLICLTAGSVIGTLVNNNALYVNGVSVPLADQYVLLPSEQKEISDAVTAFNNIIKAETDAVSSRVVLVDANAALKDLKAGNVSYGGVKLGASISPPNGAFSLDGVHPNAIGSAHIANVIIKAINAKWSSTLTLVNPLDYPGNDALAPQ